MPDILDYTLAQVRGFVAACERSDAARDARALSLIAIGARGDARQLDQTLDRLVERAQSS
jgi:2-methylisocitrate lyase-like PEP mutase family enzyme